MGYFLNKGLLFGVAVSLAAQCIAADVYHVSLSGSITNIQDAIDLTSSGDTVLIHDGHYILHEELRITNAITVTSLNGPLSTRIDGNDLFRGFSLGDVACVIEGLTITNGYFDGDGGGIYCEDFSRLPLITNCVITHCESVYGGGVFAGTVVGCKVVNNTAEDGGGIYDTTAVNSLISHNFASFIGGGGAVFSAVYNCTVVKNETSGDGGGLDVCEIYNAVVYGNTAAGSGNDINSADELYSSCSPDALHMVDGNSTNDPVFINFSGDDFNLSTNSPCKNMGDNTYVSSEYDLAAKPRVVDGTVDMGAYEVQITPFDTDGDGMRDSWEVQFFGHITNGIPGAHDDADVFYNLQEYIAGTDPTNSASYFSISNSAANGHIVYWEPVSNRLYDVLWTTNMAQGFRSLDTGLEYPRNSLTNTSENAAFFNVRVRMK